MNAFRRAPRSSDTFIGRDMRVDGRIEFSGTCVVQGSVQGSISALPDQRATLEIRENGNIDGAVRAPDVTLNGAVRGDIVCSRRCILLRSARVEGNLSYHQLDMRPGAVLQGMLSKGKTSR